MEEINLEQLKNKLNIDLDNIKIVSKKDNSILMEFNERILVFRINTVKQSFQIINFNIYDKYKSKGEEFTSLAEKTINSIVKYCKKQNFKLVEALFVQPKAENFWKNKVNLIIINQTGIYRL